MSGKHAKGVPTHRHARELGSLNLVWNTGAPKYCVVTSSGKIDFIQDDEKLVIHCTRLAFVHTLYVVYKLDKGMSNNHD